MCSYTTAERYRSVLAAVTTLFDRKHSEDTMPEVKSIFREVLPKQGQLSMEDVPTMVLCKPKLLPLKSVTLEKLEKMQMEAQEAVKQQELAMKEQLQ
nr:BBSome-interacting protein 1 [Epinephelus lanceolatus]